MREWNRLIMNHNDRAAPPYTAHADPALRRAGQSVRARRGYVLLAVLGLATVITALGLSFLDSHSTAMPAAVNYYRSVRAQYIAESGVSLGSHFLLYPPTTVPFNGYYTGANNIAIDASSDYANITVLRSDAWSPPLTDPHLYRIISTGAAHDPDGALRGKRTVTAEVLTPPDWKWKIPYAVFNKTSLTVPSCVSVYGSIHANGGLTGNLGSYCNGIVSATSTALWFGGGPPSMVLSLRPAYTGPTGSLSKYRNYTIKGKSYSAHTSFVANEITVSSAATLNAIDMSATNPGRIVSCKSGNFRLRAGADFTGTLLVEGDLEIDDAGSHVLRAVEGFPALVVTGDIKFLNDDTALTVIGSIICGDDIHVNDKKRVALNLTGSLILPGIFRDARSDGNIRITWDAGRSTFWNLESQAPLEPITVLSWKEN